MLKSMYSQTFLVKFVLGMFFCFGLLGCKSSQRIGRSSALESASRFADLPADEDAVVPPSKEHRSEIISRAGVYMPEPSGGGRRERTILQGPQQFQWKDGRLVRKNAAELGFNQFVTCDYQEPWTDDKPGGKTPKFFCYQQSEGQSDAKRRKLKVKYDSFQSPSVNTGVYGEVLATRLLWALGYPVDTVFPVQVRCVGCPEDPWKHISSYWELIATEQRGGGQSSAGAKKADLRRAAVRFVKEHLSRFEQFSNLEIKTENDVQLLKAKDGQVVFSTGDGMLNLGEGKPPISIYDTRSSRLKTVDIKGAKDLQIAHLSVDDTGPLTLFTRDFVSAIVEFKHNSIPIEMYYHQGWSIGQNSKEPKESIDIRNVRNNDPELKLQRQELALLAAFIGHADNKDEQQRVICLDPEKIEAEDKDCKKEKVLDPRVERCQEGTNQTFTNCNRPLLMLQDLGFTMGFGAKTSGKDRKGETQFDSSPQARLFGAADAAGFLEAPIFRDEARCLTTVNNWATGFDISEEISESARQNLVTKLQALADNDADMTGLFQSARLHLKRLHAEQQPPPPLRADIEGFGGSGGDLEAKLVGEFKDAFRKKVAELAKMSCPK
jgi:hypothetical protein